MSRCVMRRCSTSCQAEYGRCSGRRPRASAGMSDTASSNVACASCQARAFPSRSRMALSLILAVIMTRAIGQSVAPSSRNLARPSAIVPKLFRFTENLTMPRSFDTRPKGSIGGDRRRPWRYQHRYQHASAAPTTRESRRSRQPPRVIVCRWRLPCPISPLAARSSRPGPLRDCYSGRPGLTPRRPRNRAPRSSPG